MSTVPGVDPRVASTVCHAFSNGFAGGTPPSCECSACCAVCSVCSVRITMVGSVGHVQPTCIIQLLPWHALFPGGVHVTFLCDSMGSMQKSEALVSTSSIVG